MTRTQWNLFRTACLVGSFLAAISEAPADSLNYTQIDVPGAYWTSAIGINNSGDVVGDFHYRWSTDHGFLYSGGRFTTIDFPGATSTEAYGINDSGVIVGQFSDGTGWHGFLDSGGIYTPFNVPGAFQTFPYGINSSGEIVGGLVDAAGSHGFLDNGGTLTTIDFPGTDWTSAEGISNNGEIVGIYYVPSEYYGFLDNEGTLTAFNYGYYTFLNAINDSGDIVGQSSHGAFLYSGGVFRSIHVPGSSFTGPNGINDGEEIVGSFQNSSGTHGFVATPPYPLPPPAEPGTLLLLGTGVVGVLARLRGKRQ